MKAEFTDPLAQRAATDHEVLNQLMTLGKPGITAVVKVHEQLDKDAPMRAQIESYTKIKQRLGLG